MSSLPRKKSILVKSFTVKPPTGGKGHENVDTHLKVRLVAKAGPHDLGVTFLKQSASLVETGRQPYNSHFNLHRHPRLAPAVYQVSITGPYGAKGPGDTPSRRRIFIAQPKSVDDDEACAKQILAALLRRAYRRPVGAADVKRLLPLLAFLQELLAPSAEGPLQPGQEGQRLWRQDLRERWRHERSDLHAIGDCHTGRG